MMRNVIKLIITALIFTVPCILIVYTLMVLAIISGG